MRTLHSILARSIAAASVIGLLSISHASAQYYWSTQNTESSACGTTWTACPTEMTLRCQNGQWECVLSLTSVQRIGPIINRLTPDSGSVASDVTIEGTGFSRSANTVYFGDTTFHNVPSADGRRLTFRVPVTRDAGCNNSSRCVRYARGYETGTYSVSIQSRRGGPVSNTMRYIITHAYVSPSCTDDVPTCGANRRAACISGVWECQPIAIPYSSYTDVPSYEPPYYSPPPRSYSPPTYFDDRYNGTYDNTTYSSGYHGNVGCSVTPPNCHDWMPVCVGEGWRCDPPYNQRTNDYPDNNYHPYDDTYPYHGSMYNYDNNYRRYDRYDYTNDPCRYTPPNCGSRAPVCTPDGWRCIYPTDSASCRPTVACTAPNSSCPSGTSCGAYREGYACIPVNCDSGY